MKEMLRMALVLTLISAVAGFLLATTDRITREPIAQARLAEKLAAVAKVLPEHDNDPMSAVCEAEDNGRAWIFYVARQQGEFAGAAFECVSDQGYSGAIRLLIGVRPDQGIQGIEILEQSETPGLGARIADPDFLAQFKERLLNGTVWAVGKDGGEVDAITGATISARAVAAAIKEGATVYSRHLEAIKAAGH